MKFNLMKICLSLLVFGSVTSISFSQSTTWYFGNNAGLRFNGTATPTPLAPGILNPTTTTPNGSRMTTNEGSTAVTDVNGNVLFYADGKFAWHGATNSKLPNETAAQDLLGGASATHAALVIPIPTQECNKFILFTLKGVEDASTPGYCAVNPLGIGVTLITISGTYPTHTVSLGATVSYLNTITFSEKQASVSDGSGGYWLLHHDFNMLGSPTATTFYKHRITSSFSTVVTTADVITRLNAVRTTENEPSSTTYSGSCPSGQGQMKFSPDGKFIGAAISGAKAVDIFAFNAATGAIGLKYTLTTTGASGDASNVYGLEFSPNSKYVYSAGGYFDTGTNFTSRIFQWDVTIPTTTPRSQVVSHTSTCTPSGESYGFNSLQLGVDNRIYVSGPGSKATCPVSLLNKLSVINFPNLAAASVGFTLNSITLASGTTRALGLPTVVSTKTCAPPTNLLCTCPGVTSTAPTSSLTYNGNANVTLRLNSGTKLIKRVKVSLNGWEQTISDACKDFTTISTIDMGNFIFPITSPVGYTAFMGQSVLTQGSLYAPDITLENGGVPAVLTNADFQLKMRFPPAKALSDCPNNVKFCFKIELFDANCNVCETILCLDKTGTYVGPPPPTRMAVANSNDQAILNPEKENLKINIFPNPNHGNIKVNINEDIKSGAYEIFDFQGKLKLIGSLNAKSNEVNLKEIPKGSYIIKINTDKFNHSEIIVKE